MRTYYLELRKSEAKVLANAGLKIRPATDHHLWWKYYASYEDLADEFGNVLYEVEVSSPEEMKILNDMLSYVRERREREDREYQEGLMLLEEFFMREKFSDMLVEA